MLIKRLSFIAAIGLLGLLPVPAQEAPAPLTLQQCIEIAFEQQGDVLQGARAVDAANARQVQAKSSYYPQITVGATSRVLESGMPRGSDRTAGTLSVSQNLYDGGLREARVSQAKSGIAQNAAGLERTRQTVAFDVTRSYLGLLRAKRLAGVAESQLQYIQGQLDMVQARVQAGDAAEVDVIPIEAQLANAQVDQLAAKNAVRTAAIALQQAMGLPPQAAFPIQEVEVPTDAAVPALEDCLAQAKTLRPDVRGVKAGVDSAKTSVKTAKIEMYPRPVVTGQLDQDFTGSSDRTVAVSAGLAFDLFNGGNNRAVYDEAQANLASAEIRAAQLDKDIAAQVQTAYLNLTDARERMNASELSVKSAQRNMDVQQERYRQGMAIPLDLLNAQVTLTTANSNAVQARYDYYTALAQLDYAMGKQGGWYAEK
ncbi:MAG: TolC family protein [Armatimonadota bacterium]